MDRRHLDSMIEKVNSYLQDSLYHCIECEWEAQSQIFRIYIDHPEGMDISRCVETSKMLADAVFIDESIPGQYTLEVSSPGIERPLRFADDFRSNLGKRVEVTLLTKVAGRKKGEGTLAGVSDDGVVELDLAEGSGTWAFSVNELRKANLLWNMT